jgi:hypothetical protein
VVLLTLRNRSFFNAFSAFAAIMVVSIFSFWGSVLGI